MVVGCLLASWAMRRADREDGPHIGQTLRSEDSRILPVLLSSHNVLRSPDSGVVSAEIPQGQASDAETSGDHTDALGAGAETLGEEAEDDYVWSALSDDETPLTVSFDIAYDVVKAAGSEDAAPGGVAGRMPMLAVVLDDVGYSMSLAMRVISLDLPLTLAVIPGVRYSGAIAAELDKRGIPYLAHIPMQAVGDPDGRAGHVGLKNDYAIGVGMTEPAMRETLIPLIDSLPGAYGASNHRGSKVTSDPDMMKIFMSLLKERDLFFLDSHTTANTVAYETARAEGLRTAKNSFFIDHEGDAERISAAFDRALGVVTKAGSAVAICHMRLETIKFLEELKRKDMKAAGVNLVTLTQLMMERERRKGDM
jgi:polysaccharide deacetylase 2 family uncharacterized protein YibQ